MHRRNLILAAAAAPLGGLLAACSRIPDTVRIGVAQPLSGPLGELGKDMLAGVQMALRDLNAANYSVQGKRVQLELLAKDDKSDPATGSAVAQELVDAGVVAVIGHLNSGVSIEAAPIYAKAGIAQLAISTNPRYTQLELATTLRLVANDDMQAKAMASYALGQIGAQRYALVDDATPYGKGLMAGVAALLKKHDKAPAVSASLDAKTTQFDELVARLVAARIDSVITTLADFQVEALVKAMGKTGLREATLLGGDTIKTSTLPKLDLPIRAVYATSPIIEPYEFNAGPAFEKRYSELAKQGIVYGAHYAHDAVYSITQGLTRAGSADPAAVLKAMKALDLHGPVTASLRYDAQGEQKFGTISVYAIEKGRWVSAMRSADW